MTSNTEQPHQVEEISCLLAPVCGQKIILPNVTVAEIIEYQPPGKIEGFPDWVEGLLHWRTLSIPLISLEKLQDNQHAEIAAPTRIAICNGITGSQKLAFYGIVLCGIPRSCRVDRKNVSEDSSPVPSGLQISVNGEQVLLPDLDFVEQQLIDCLYTLH